MKPLLGLALAAIALSSCSSSSGSQLPAGTQWVLSKVQLDPKDRLETGRLPYFQRVGDTAFGRGPYATGSLGVTSEGRCVVQVEFFEPSGRANPLRYQILDFAGFLDTGSGRIVQFGRPDVPAPGEATALTTSVGSDGLMRIQVWSGPRQLPYSFEFAPRGAGRGVVPVPTVD